MGRLVREKDWSRAPLGADRLLAAKPADDSLPVSGVQYFPISQAWGPRHIQIYNDGYWPICGDKHPHALGQDFTECWASAFQVIGDAFRSAQAGTRIMPEMPACTLRFRLSLLQNPNTRMQLLPLCLL